MIIIIHFLNNSFSQCDRISFSHILREANFLVGALATVAHIDSAQIWEHSLPSSTYPTFNLHYSGVECPRGSSV